MKKSHALFLKPLAAARFASLAAFAFSLHSNSASASEPSSETKNEILLDGKWSFKLLPSETQPPADSFWRKDFDSSAWDLIDVPSCWEMKGFGKPLYDERISGESGLYVRRFSLPRSWPQGGTLRIRFEGVMFGAKVWINSREAADFTSSFNEYEFDVTHLVDRTSENTIAVRTHGHPKGAEFDTNDDWTLHGIHRSVAIVHRPDVHLKSFRHATKVRGDDASVHFKAELSGKGGIKATLFDPSGAIAATLTDCETNLTVKGAKFWTAETPSLYRLKIKVYDPCGRNTETVCKKVGLREVSWQDGVFKVNGFPVKLRGVNHHDMSPKNGRTVTVAEQREDMKLAKAANCNFIRTSHYPPSKALLEACDEIGLYVLDEIPFGLGERFLEDESYCPILIERTELTIARDVNHASVIAWGVGNENPVTPIALAAAKRTKELDPSRPWCFPMQPGTLVVTLDKRPVSDLGDIVNWHYPAVRGDADELKGKYLPKFDRPYISGEYAHSLGLDFGNLEWYWDELIWNDERYAGGAVWMFSDQGILRKASELTPEQSKHCVWPDPGHVWDSYGIFGTDGVVYSDRTPQIDYYELRKVYSPVKLGEAKIAFAGNDLAFSAPIENRFDSLPLADAVETVWKVFADQVMIASAKAPTPELMPHAKGTLSFSCRLPEHNASVVRAEVEFIRRADGAKVYERSYPALLNIPDTAAPSSLRLSFDGSSNNIVFRDSSGVELMRSPLIARVDRRPMISKDLRTGKFDRWSPNSLEPTSVKVLSASDSHISLEAIWKPASYTLTDRKEQKRELAGHVDFKVENNRVRVEYSFSYSEDREILETGFALEFPPEFTHFGWAGLGPYECYPGASALSEFGIFTLHRDDLYFSGNRQNVHMAVASSQEGLYAAITPSRPSDIVFERRGGKTLVGHNAFAGGKATKFNIPLGMKQLKAGEKLQGSFRFTPPAKESKAVLAPIFGDPSAVKAFMPFYRTYDY